VLSIFPSTVSQQQQNCLPTTHRIQTIKPFVDQMELAMVVDCYQLDNVNQEVRALFINRGVLMFL